MEKFTLIFFMLIYGICFSQNQVIDNKFVSDSLFETKLNEMFVNYTVDFDSFSNSNVFYINQNQNIIDIKYSVLIDLKDDSLLYNLNKLIFFSDETTIIYFLEKINANKKIVLSELTKYSDNPLFLILFYASINNINYDEFANLIGYRDSLEFNIDEPSLYEVFYYRKDICLRFLPMILTNENVSDRDMYIISSYLYLSGIKKYINSIVENNSITNNEELDNILREFKIKK